ncbi:phosphoadenylyl-sulfate reductase [Polymorphum gilvum]|uniref:Adenosine 5'-phosphosulfate reductase n=1 Tax=Polymorphum gilvum (strain LMG 25793 / CGMCC 1.9160 / SL003B-26A1) TaxID=991905 RepID=F2J107_POLGS|nr:phosphoadenylyl-sulfate reductase [Polymorphum gilvum]ADZ71953.1 Phosphoadenosine phosphosulfate reductase CysH-type [Polymorphum gilvum SL003B-26A1]
MALADIANAALDPELALGAEARALAARYGEAPAEDILRAAIREQYRGEIAMVSSFGADSAVLLHMVARIDRTTPVLFIDTGKLFPETLRYRDRIVAQLGLADIRSLGPDPQDLAASDPGGMLWMSDTDRCCHVRKVLPLDRALKGFAAWISGRKRFQGGVRAALPVFEAEDGRIKVNPLAGWSAGEILAYARSHDLPPHPLVAQGYPSIGCLPCTDKVRPGEDARAGRWRGQAKTECGIHLTTHGREIDGSGI